MRDLTGQRFGSLVVVSLHRSVKEKYGSSNGIQYYWLCRCDCGVEKVARASNLIYGNTRSCGCLQRKAAASTGNLNRRHGRTRTVEYRVWMHMKQRCGNPNDGAYHNYGGRGIYVCAEWYCNFERFLEDMGTRPSPEYELDRIDNDGPYAPWNCRWVTRDIQSRNKRTNVNLSRDDKTQCITDWAKELGITQPAMSYRIKNGWSEARATSEPNCNC